MDEATQQQPANDPAVKPAAKPARRKLTPAERKRARAIRQADQWKRAHAAVEKKQAALKKAQAIENAIWESMGLDARAVLVEEMVNININGKDGWWRNQ